MQLCDDFKLTTYSKEFRCMVTALYQWRGGLLNTVKVHSFECCFLLVCKKTAKALLCTALTLISSSQLKWRSNRCCCCWCCWWWSFSHPANRMAFSSVTAYLSDPLQVLFTLTVEAGCVLGALCLPRRDRLCWNYWLQCQLGSSLPRRHPPRRYCAFYC